MKIKIITVVAFFCSQLISAGEKPGNFRAQLEDLNKFWIGRNVDHVQLSKRKIVVGEVHLIQNHLSLVEGELRRANTDNLSSQQKLNRLRCLDILHAYWTAGTFPRNLYHKERTPTFIDDLGTACAVGQLIISTGSEKLAKKISIENNCGYLNDLAKIYPDISEWANEHGFNLSELAWIQPCYCGYNKTETRHVSCHGGSDGYYKPDLSALDTVKQMRAFKLVSGVWSPDGWCGLCNITAGRYKFEAKDGSDIWHSFEEEITEPSPPIITSFVSGDPIGCNATATILVTNASGPLSYTWTENPSNTNIASGLCQQTYSVYIKENNHCMRVKEVDLSGASSVIERTMLKLELYPNPVRNYLTLNLSSTDNKPIQLSIYNALGVCYKHIDLLTGNVTIDANDLQPGIYFVTAKAEDGNEFFRRFVKD